MLRVIDLSRHLGVDVPYRLITPHPSARLTLLWIRGIVDTQDIQINCDRWARAAPRRAAYAKTDLQSASGSSQKSRQRPARNSFPPKSEFRPGAACFRKWLQVPVQSRRLSRGGDWGLAR